MRKFIFLLLSTFALNAHALECPDGIIVVGKNKLEYCSSKITTNWFTAFAWCDARGMKLQTVHQICDTDEAKWDGNIGTEKCVNMVGAEQNSEYVWTALPYGRDKGFYVNLKTGEIFNNGPRNYSAPYGRAICR